TKNCLNPHLLSAKGGYEVAAGELIARLIELGHNYSELEGVTVLGGEPFDQARGLAEVLSQVRPRGLSTMVYTGHVFEELQRRGDPDAGALLASTDLLVDGPFIDALHDERLIWRGSTNQRVVRLTGRYAQADLDAA